LQLFDAQSTHGTLVVETSDKAGNVRSVSCIFMRGSDVTGISLKIPGTAGIVEKRQALLPQSVLDQFANLAMAVPIPATLSPDANADKLRRPSVGDLGKRLTPIGLA
jgi:hypothetical protein